MKRIYFLILVCFAVINCKQKSTEDKIIDLGHFSITVPNDFEYKKLRGIDSFVGKITNGEATFTFDYGWYSPKPPLTEQQYLEENSKRLGFDAFNSLVSIIDLTPYEDEKGSINPSDISKKIKNVKLNKTTTDTKFSNSKNTKRTYHYTFEFDQKEYTIPFYGYEENRDKFNDYSIKTDTLNDFERTISIYKGKDTSKYHSVYFINLDKNPNSNQLWLGIPSNHKLSQDVLKVVFNSLKMKSKKSSKI
ncbi:hypothetical protein [Kordia sp.]|uniref:hypothetical protein n=1 Tax=Kordia sp. TaxID=1965332 RepID=UPI003B5CB9E0